MNNPLSQGRVLVAAHRGSWGGSIFPNTIPAFENALVQGADIIEMDVVKSIDGEFFVINDEQLPSVLDLHQDIRSLTAGQFRALHYLSYTFRRPQHETVNSLDEVLEHFKGRCLINIDRAWFSWNDLFPVLKRHDMFEQIVLKARPSDTLLGQLEASGLPIMYMPIIKTIEEMEIVDRYRLRKVAVEIVFDKESNGVVQPEFLSGLHKQGLVLWVNTLTLTDDIVLCAGHDDRHAILEGRDRHWGWLVQRGFDVFQTDWPLLLRQYLA